MSLIIIFLSLSCLFFALLPQPNIFLNEIHMSTENKTDRQSLEKFNSLEVRMHDRNQEVTKAPRDRKDGAPSLRDL